MDKERQSLENKRKILKKLKKLLDEWNDEFQSMDPDVRQYFDKVDKDFRHLDKNLRGYFEKLSKEFEIEENEYKKLLQAQKKAERAAQTEAKANEEEIISHEVEKTEKGKETNEPEQTVDETHSAKTDETPSPKADDTDGEKVDETNSPTADEKRDSKTQSPQGESLQRASTSTPATPRTAIADMRALFEQSVAACKGEASSTIAAAGTAAATKRF